MRLLHLYMTVCLSVGPLVGWLVRRSVSLSVGNAFVKIAKSIGKSQFFASLCTYITCPSIHRSIRPLFCLLFCSSVCPYVHPYICNHIIGIAKSIAKSSEINWNLVEQFDRNITSIEWKEYWKENCIEKPHRCSYKLSFHKDLVYKDISLKNALNLKTLL